MNKLTLQPMPITFNEQDALVLVERSTAITNMQEALFKTLNPKQHYYKIGDSSLSLSQGGADHLRLVLGLVAEKTRTIEKNELHGNALEIKVYSTCRVYKDGNLVAVEEGMASTSEKGIASKDMGFAEYQTITKADKRAFVKAIRSASGLTAMLSQDLEDMEPEKREKANVGKKDEDPKINKDHVIKVNHTYKQVLGKQNLSDKDKLALNKLVVEYGTLNELDWVSTADITMSHSFKFRTWLRNKEVNNDIKD